MIKALKNRLGIGFWGNVFLKTLFAIVILFFLYRQIFHNTDIKLSWNLFLEKLDNANVLLLGLCIALMPMNWLAESIKWKVLVQKFEQISLWTSYKAILSGVSIALLTPNRIGEYGGRMVMVDAKHNWKAVLSTLVCSYAQNICNIGIGLIASCVLLYQDEVIGGFLFGSLLSLSFLLILCALFFFFNVRLVHAFLEKFKKNRYVSKVLNHSEILFQYSEAVLGKVLIWSLIRYFIYFLQYYLILIFFGLEMDLWTAFIGISTIFLLQTSLPLPPIIGFIARGEIALLVWQGSQMNDLSILAASYTLWIVNLLLPSLLGSAFILSANLWTSLGLKNFKKLQ